MPWQANYDEHNKIVEIIYSGTVTQTEIQETITAGCSLSHQIDSKLFLSDCRTVYAGPSPFKLLDTIEHFNEKGCKRNMKQALLLPSARDARDSVLFYENACVNRGYTVKAFDSRDEAMEWLTKIYANPANPSQNIQSSSTNESRNI